MHLKGKTHQLMKKTLFLEKLEDENVKDEIEIVTRQINSYLLNPKNYGFRLPPIHFPKNFKIPDEPKNFKLPKFFDFTDHENFKPDINETLQNLFGKNI